MGCKFMSCGKEQGLEFCCECEKFPCTRLKKFSSLRPGEEVRHYRHVTIYNLCRLREVCIERWVEEIEIRFKRWEYHIGASGNVYRGIPCACVMG